MRRPKWAARASIRNGPSNVPNERNSSPHGLTERVGFNLPSNGRLLVACHSGRDRHRATIRWDFGAGNPAARFIKASNRKERPRSIGGVEGLGRRLAPSLHRQCTPAALHFLERAPPAVPTARRCLKATGVLPTAHGKNHTPSAGSSTAFQFNASSRRHAGDRHAGFAHWLPGPVEFFRPLPLPPIRPPHSCPGAGDLPPVCRAPKARLGPCTIAVFAECVNGRQLTQMFLGREFPFALKERVYSSGLNLQVCQSAQYHPPAVTRCPHEYAQLFPPRLIGVLTTREPRN